MLKYVLPSSWDGGSAKFGKYPYLSYFWSRMASLINVSDKHLWDGLTNWLAILFFKNPGHGRHWISWCVQIVAPIPKNAMKVQEGFVMWLREVRWLIEKKIFCSLLNCVILGKTALTTSRPLTNNFTSRDITYTQYTLNRPSGSIQWKSCTHATA